jgi:hypothetical protein
MHLLGLAPTGFLASPDTVAMLNAVRMRIMNQAAQGWDFQVQANEFEEITFEQAYRIEKVGPQQFEISLKQQ